MARDAKPPRAMPTGWWRIQKGAQAMRDYRQDVRMRPAGRDPDGCKVLFMGTPVLANTDEEAQGRAAQRGVVTTEEIHRRLG